MNAREQVSACECSRRKLSRRGAVRRPSPRQRAGCFVASFTGTRCWSIMLAAFFVFGMAYAANTFAAEVPTHSSIVKPALRLQYVDANRTENWPQGNWQPIRASELLSAMRPQPPIARILSANYSARYSAGQLLEGRLRFELRNEIAPTPVAVSLEPMDLPILSPRWVSDRPLILGTNPVGQTNVLLTRSQDVLEAGFRATGEARGAAVEVHISLPPAARSTLQLLVPRDQRLVSDVGTETVSEIPGQSDHRQWTVHVSGQPDIRLLFVPESAIDSIDRVPPVVLQELSYVVRRGTTRVDASFNVDLHNSTLNALTFDMSGPDVDLIAVQLGDRPLTGWTLQPNGTARQLIVPLPEPLSNALPRLSLQFTAALEVTGAVTLPSLRLKDSFVQDGRAVVRLPSAGILADIHYPGYRYQDQSRSAVEGIIVVLKQARPDASVIVTFADGQSELRVKSLSHIRTTDAGAELDAVLEWTASRGGEFEATAIVPPGWDVNSVTSWSDTSAGDLGSWDVSATPLGRRIRVQFRNALDPERSRMVRILAKGSSPSERGAQPAGFITAEIPARTIFAAVATSTAVTAVPPPASGTQAVSASRLPQAVDAAFSGREWQSLRNAIPADADWRYADESDLTAATKLPLDASVATDSQAVPGKTGAATTGSGSTGSATTGAVAENEHGLQIGRNGANEAVANPAIDDVEAHGATGGVVDGNDGNQPLLPADLLAAHFDVRIGSLDEQTVRSQLQIQVAGRKSESAAAQTIRTVKQSIDLLLPSDIETLSARSSDGLVEIQKLEQGAYRLVFPATLRSSSISVEYSEAVSSTLFAVPFVRRISVTVPQFRFTVESASSPACFSIGFSQPVAVRTWLADPSQWSGDSGDLKSSGRLFGILSGNGPRNGRNNAAVNSQNETLVRQNGLLSDWSIGQRSAFRPINQFPKSVAFVLVDKQAWWCVCLMMMGIAVLYLAAVRRLSPVVRACTISVSLLLLLGLVLGGSPIVAELGGSLLAGCVIGWLIPTSAFVRQSFLNDREPTVPAGSTHAFAWRSSSGKSTAHRLGQGGSIIAPLVSIGAIVTALSVAVAAASMQVEYTASAVEQRGSRGTAYRFSEIETVLVPFVRSAANGAGSSSNEDLGSALFHDDKLRSALPEIDPESLVYVSPTVAAWTAAQSKTAYAPPDWLIRNARYTVTPDVSAATATKVNRKVRITAEFELQIRRSNPPERIEFPWVGSNLQSDTACTIDGHAVLTEISPDGTRLIVRMPQIDKPAADAPPTVLGPVQEIQDLQAAQFGERSNNREVASDSSRTSPQDGNPASSSESSGDTGLYDLRVLKLIAVAANGSDAGADGIRAKLTTPKVLVSTVSVETASSEFDRAPLELWAVNSSETPTNQLQVHSPGVSLLGATTNWMITTVTPNRTLPLIEPDLDSAVLVDLSGENTLFRQRLRTVVADGNRRRIVLSIPRGAVLLSASCARTAVRSLQVATSTDWETILYFATPLQRGDVIDLVWAWTAPSEQILTVPSGLLIPRQPDFGSIPPRWAWAAVKHAADIRCELSANNPERFRLRTPTEFAAFWGSDSLIGLQSAATVENSTDLLIRRTQVTGRLELQASTLVLDVQSRNVQLTYSTTLQPVATATFPIRIEVPGELMVESVKLGDKDIPLPARWSQIGRQIVLFPDERLSRNATLTLSGSLRSMEGEFEELPLVRINDASSPETLFRLRTSPGATVDIADLDLRPEKLPPDEQNRSPNAEPESPRLTESYGTTSATAVIPASTTTLRWKRQRRQILPDAYLVVAPDAARRRWSGNLVFQTVEPASWPSDVGCELATELPVTMNLAEGATVEVQKDLQPGVSVWQIRATKSPLAIRRIGFEWPMDGRDSTVSPPLPEFSISGAKSLQFWFLPLDSGLAVGTDFVAQRLPTFAFRPKSNLANDEQAFLFSPPKGKAVAETAPITPGETTSTRLKVPAIQLATARRKPTVMLQAIVRCDSSTAAESVAINDNGSRLAGVRDSTWIGWNLASQDRNVVSIAASAESLLRVALNGVPQNVAANADGRFDVAVDAAPQGQWLEIHWKESDDAANALPQLWPADVASGSALHPLVIWDRQSSSRLLPVFASDASLRTTVLEMPALKPVGNEVWVAERNPRRSSYSPILWQNLLSAIQADRDSETTEALSQFSFENSSSEIRTANTISDADIKYTAARDGIAELRATDGVACWMVSNSDTVTDAPMSFGKRFARPAIDAAIAVLVAVFVWCLEAAGVMTRLRSRSFAAWGSIAVWWAWWLTPTFFAGFPLLLAIMQGVRQHRDEYRSKSPNEWSASGSNRYVIADSRLSH